AVTAHNVNALSSVTFATVLTGATAAAPLQVASAGLDKVGACAEGWSCGLVGGATSPSASYTGGAGTVPGSGTFDGTADQGSLVAQFLPGDATISARVNLGAAASGSSGLMVRQGMSAGSPYYGAFVAPESRSVVVEYRSQAGMAAVRLASLPLTSLPQ